MNKLSIIFGSNLRNIRKAHKISQRDFAEKADLSESTILGLENGQVAIQFETLEKICATLNVPPTVFFVDENSGENDIVIQKIQHAIKDLSPEKLELVYNLIRNLKNI